MNKQKLYEIIDEYWEDYQNKKNLSGVIKDSIPIIWFGDINKYFTSNIRTITVGLNPSKYEFINKNVIIESLRFKNTDNFKNNKDLDNEQKDILIDSYNNYFKYNPYETWFKWNDDNIMKFMNTEGGEALARREKKRRIGVYMEKELVERADEMVSYVGARSRNEFVAEAVNFYIGFLNSRKAENYLLQSLSSVLTSTVHDSENRLARMDFKLAVEISKLAHVIAYSHEVDEDALKKLHLKCVDEVKRINGAVEFEGAYKYQKREV